VRNSRDHRPNLILKVRILFELNMKMKLKRELRRSLIGVFLIDGNNELSAIFTKIKMLKRQERKIIQCRI